MRRLNRRRSFNIFLFLGHALHLLKLVGMENQTALPVCQNLFGKISDKKLFWIITALAAVFYLCFLGFRALWDPGEGRYALVASEMLKNNDWVIPTLNEIKYFEKPPLVYWLTSVSMWLFGKNEFSARLPTALAALLTVIGTYFFARRTFDRKTAIFSSAVLFTSFGFFTYSQVSEIEMLFACFMCWGLGFLIVDFERGKRRAIPIHTGYLMIALAFMTKGISAFVIAISIMVVYLAITKQWYRWQRLYPFTGIILILLVTAPWFMAVSIKQPEVLKSFFMTDFFGRISPDIKKLWYYIPVLIIAFAPWIVVLFNALKKTWLIKNSLKPHTKKVFIYLVVWFGIGFTIFSFSHDKRPPYILPVLVPIAIVTGFYFANIWNKHISLKKTLAALILVFSFLAAALFFLPGYTTHLASSTDLPLAAPLTILSVFIIMTVIFIKKSDARKVFLLMFSFAMVFDTTIYLQSLKLDSIFSRKKLAGVVMSEYKPGEKIFAYRCKFERNMQSFGFYTGQRIYIVGDRGELEFGSKLDRETDKYFPSEKEFYEYFRNPHRIYAVIRFKHYGFLQNKGLNLYPANVMAGDFLVVSNKPWQERNTI